MAKVSFLVSPEKQIPTPHLDLETSKTSSGKSSELPDQFLRKTSSGTARFAVDTAIIPESAPWSIVERVGYTLHSPVWWTRRLTFSRPKDAAKVAAFVQENGLWNARSKTATAVVSARALKHLEVQRRFWWISDNQIQKLANGLSAVHRQSNEQPRSLDALVANALFDMPLDFRDAQ